MDTAHRPLLHRWDLLPLAAALALGALTWAAWSQLPVHLPIHFGPTGKADGFAPRTIALGMMFGLPALGWLFTAFLGRLTGQRDAALMELQAQALPPFRGLFTAALLVIMALPILVPLAGGGVVWPVLGLFFALLLAGIVLLALGVRTHIPRELRASYRWGLFYVNAEDPRLWVPKLIGVGWTLNFARPASWFVMAGLLALPVAALVFLK
jgi:uncharacterized membrane protein